MDTNASILHMGNLRCDRLSTLLEVSESKSQRQDRDPVWLHECRSFHDVRPSFTLGSIRHWSNGLWRVAWSWITVHSWGRWRERGWSGRVQNYQPNHRSLKVRERECCLCPFGCMSQYLCLSQEVRDRVLSKVKLSEYSGEASWTQRSPDLERELCSEGRTECSPDPGNSMNLK